ncbi:hypothetical protein KIL84_013067 [Mauremys mutica]|uniref:FAD-binding PCMH-type domain-containing protein n=1 Tax=Mauremys mutica TaxID=74926 RepID=A0A9D3XS57_9SAUR|nr:hypothetical protein KIL84_013067 [Mauremys mutica]
MSQFSFTFPRHYPANSCLLPICSLHGSAVTTVEGVGSTKTRVHPIQERLAKCHGSQCGFCTPGMVMSMYALLRNHPEPSMEQITAALDGNLCRCTGYRPIIDTYKSFAGETACCQLRGTGQCCLDKEDVCSSSNKGNQMHSGLCNPEEFQPVDPTQEFIFPPELMRMAQEQRKITLVFRGERTTWISPTNLRELLELKAMYPKAPLVVGNTCVGLEMKLDGVHHPVIIHPTRIPDLHVVSNTNNGLVIGAACSLAQLRDILMKVVLELPEEKTKIFRALLQQLKTLAGEQIRSLASLGGHIVSRGSTWDLNPVLAVGNSVLSLASKDGTRQIPLNDQFLAEYENADLKPKEIIVSVLIPYSKKDAIKHNSYFGKEKKLEQGNIEEGFKSADEIIEGEIHIGGQEHFYLETNCVLVVPRGEDNEMDVHVSTQDAARVQDFVALALDVQSSKIMCHTKRVGGAFGGKVTKPIIFAVVAAVAANKTGRPIRFTLERDEDMLITGGRHPFFGKYKVGFTNDGRITAADIESYINAGCTLDESELVIEFVVLKMDNAYKIPNLRVRGRACKTNLPSNTAFRGFGFPQSGLFTESWITTVATQTGLPQEKIREKNMYKGVNLTPFKEELDATNLVKCWKECMEKSEYYSRKTAVEEFNKQNYWKKKGIAIIPMKFSVGFSATKYHQAAALVHIYTDGSVLVTHGGIELGQGIHTKMLQIASRELEVPLSYVHFCETSTITVPNAIATPGSIGSDVNGKAVQNACQILRKRLEPIINKNPEGKWEDWITEAYDQSVSLSATGYFRGYMANMNWDTGEGQAFPYFVFGAACSEVEIDCLTGDHKNIRTDIVMDACFSINPAVDIGQIEGGFIQGVGLYTMEEIKFSPEGEQYTLGADTYKIPAVCDIPEQFRVYLLPNSRNPIAIYSSKGIGEAGLFLGCSVFFAIWDAVAAVRKERGLTGTFTLNSPLTPERIRMACADNFTEMIPKDKPGTYKPWAIDIA